MQRNCDVCDGPYEAKNSRSRFCGATCRSRNNRGAGPAAGKVVAPSDLDAADKSAGEVDFDEPRLVRATRKALVEADRLDTFAGQQAMHLAEQMSSNKVAIGVAALNKELSRTMAEALQGAMTKGDEVDELAARRDAKRAG